MRARLYIWIFFTIFAADFILAYYGKENKTIFG